MTITSPYSGLSRAPAAAPVSFDTSLRDSLDAPEGYLPAPDLVTAVNAAMLLGQPLLLNGEPGTGKSGLAAAVAHELALGTPFRINCKADMRSSDLFYVFDHVRRLYDANTGERRPPQDYLDLRGIGAAIVFAAGAEAELAPLREGDAPAAQRLGALLPGLGLGAPRQSVVLVDEIDKAPRDVPNDILTEIDAMCFDIPELGVSIRAGSARKPLVIITSNSEKSLPAPFLRRCVFYTIPFPALPGEIARNPDLARGADGRPAYTLENIVSGRLSDLRGTSLLTDALGIFERLRDSTRFELRPSPAEFMNWLLYLRRHGPSGDWRLADHPDLVADALVLMLKGDRDRRTGIGQVRTWLAGDGAGTPP